MCCSAHETLRVRNGAALINSSKCEKLFQYIKGISISFNIMFRVYTGSAPIIFNEVLLLGPGSSYSLRNQQRFATRPIHIAHYGSDWLNYLGPKIWGMVPSDVKNLHVNRIVG